MGEVLRKKVIREIISTEETYLKQLDILEKFFVKPCREKGLLPEHIHTALFGELAALRHMNQELYRALQGQAEDVGAAFLQLAPFLKVYSSYAKNYQQAINLLLEWEHRSSKLRSWLAATESRPEVGTKLPSLLITPVQRIPRYRLLLGELLKHTQHHHPHHPSINRAVEEVGAVAEHINQCVKKSEGLQRMFMIQRALRHGQPSILVPGRTLIKEGVLHKVSRSGNGSQPRLFFLFSDVLLYTTLPSTSLTASPAPSCSDVLDTEYKPRSLECCCLLPLRHCSIIPVLGTGQRGLFRLKCESEDLLLYSADRTGESEWVSTIEEAIQQAVKKRKTLRKDSSSRKPMRRPALRKLTLKGDSQQLLELKVSKEQPEPSEDSLASPKVLSDSTNSTKGKPSLKKGERSPSSLWSQLRQAQDCLTPPRSWLSPSKRHKAASEVDTTPARVGNVKRSRKLQDSPQKVEKKARHLLSQGLGGGVQERTQQAATSTTTTTLGTRGHHSPYAPRCPHTMTISPLAR